MDRETGFRKCANCGTENSPDSSFCKNCGSPLSDETGKNPAHPVRRISRKRKAKGSNSESKAALIVFVVLLIGGLLLLSGSGTFDFPKADTSHEGHNHPTDQNPIIPPDAGNNAAALNSQIANLENLLAAEPGNDSLQLELAHKYFDKKEFTKAINGYTLYLKNHPNSPEVLTDMGVCYFNLENFAEAEKNFLKALELDPQQQIANLNMGVVKLVQDQRDAAKEWLTKTVRLNPNSETGSRAKALLKEELKVDLDN